MQSEERSITDPFNNEVYLVEGTCASSYENSADIYDDASEVIRKPAILVEVKNPEKRELYYFRSVGWHNTLLISAHFHNSRWETFDCEKNPSNETLSVILKKGRQLL